MRAAGFNHVATAFRQILKTPGNPSQITGAGITNTGGVALQNMQDCGAQGIANTLHIIVKQRYNATGPRLLALERRVEAISGEFKSQEVANTLWAFVRMGTKSLERMIEQLEGRYQGSSSTRRTL